MLTRPIAFALAFATLTASCSTGPTGPALGDGAQATDAGPNDAHENPTGADSMGVDAGSELDASVPHPRVNLLKNPSLESWSSSSTPNTNPDGWTACTIGIGIAVDAVPDSCKAAVPEAASEGNRYARAYPGEGIAQTLATTPGSTYAVSFDYCGMSGCFGGAPDSAWEVLVGEKSIVSTPANAGTTWQHATATFVATTTTTTVCFRKISDGVLQGGIDHLDVHEE